MALKCITAFREKHGDLADDLLLRMGKYGTYPSALKSANALMDTLQDEYASVISQLPIDLAKQFDVEEQTNAEEVQEEAKPEVRSTRTDTAKGELSENELSDLVDQRLAKFDHKPPVFIEEGAPDGAKGKVSNGRIVLYRSALDDSLDAVKTLFHEMLHYGLRRFLTKPEYIQKMHELYNADAWVRAKADNWVKTDEIGRKLAKEDRQYAIARGVDEALAELAETSDGSFNNNSLKARAVRRVVRWIKKLANALGFGNVAQTMEGITNDDARALIKQVFTKLEQDSAPVDADPAFTADPAFRLDTTPHQGRLGALYESANEWLADPKHKLSKIKLGSMGLNQIAERTNSAAVRLYIKTMHDMQRFSKEHIQVAAEIDKDWAKFERDSRDKAKKGTASMFDRLNDVMMRATLAEFDPADPNAKPEDAEQGALRVAYGALNPEAKALYIKVRDHYANTMEQKRKVLEDVLKEMPENSKDKKALKAQFNAIKGPYFPLMRMGDYYSVAISRKLLDLEERFQAGELSAEENKLRKEMRRDPKHYQVKGHATLRQAIKQRKAFREQGFPDAYYNTAKLFSQRELKNLPDIPKVESYMAGKFDKQTMAEIHNLLTQMYFHMAMHQSAMKREGVHGANENMREVFRDSTVKTAHHISRIKYSRDLNAAMIAVENESARGNIGMTDVFNELHLRNQIAMEHEDNALVNHLLHGSYFAHLGLNPSYYLINMLQVPMVSLPWWSARWGFAASTRQMRESASVVKGLIKSAWKKDGWEGTLDWSQTFKPGSDEDKLFREMYERNKLDITIEADMGADAGRFGSKVRDYARMANTPVRYSEMFNRALTGLTTYRLARAGGKGRAKMTHEQAVEEAIKAIDNTQLDYSALNAPRYFNSLAGSKSAARLVSQFRKFQQGMVYLVASSAYDAVKGESEQVRKEAARTLLGMYLTTGLMAGAAGVPFAGSMVFIANIIKAAFDFDDDDDYFDAATELRNWASDVLDPRTAELLSRGLPTLIGVDMSKRIGMGDIGSIVPFAREGRTAKDTAENYMIAATGAPISMMLNIVDGVEKLAQGDVAKGVERIVPLKLVSNLVKAGRYGAEGLTDSRGETILDPERFSAWDITLRASGLQTTEESRYYEGNQAVQSTKDAVMTARQKIVRDFAQARLRGERTDDIMDRVNRFNTKNPDPKVRIKQETLLKAVQYRRKTGSERTESGLRARAQDKPFLPAGRFAEM